MSHSVVRVTENKVNDSLILVVAEDGTVSPDKETVQSYLNSRAGATELQVMHVNKVDGQNIDVTLDTLMYVHSEEIIEEELEEMDQIAKNLQSFRMDHDYTPFTSPKRESPVRIVETELEDELAQTLSILEGTTMEQNAVPKPQKITKTAPKQTKKAIVQAINKQKAKMITTTTSPVTVKQAKPVTGVKTAPRKPKPPPPPIADIDSDDFEDDEDFDDLDFEEDDDSDSDFELEETPKMKVTRRSRPLRRSKSISESPLKTVKHKTPPMKLLVKPDSEILKIEKPSETQEIKPSETKPPDKKPPPKKEKKIAKPPDDFLLFSTPDIIRRVGGKEPSTPTTPTTPDVQKHNKPAKLTQENRSKSSESKLKRMSTETKILPDKIANNMGTSTEDKQKDRRISVDKPKVKTERIPSLEKKEGTKFEGHVSVQGYEESMGSNSSESLLDAQLQPLPSAEDIRAIIQNENTKSFTTSLVIPDSEMDQNNDPNQVSLESAGLDLDQSILDNINSDLISEDILYQVAQSLVDNPELQNVIDKSIVDGNLILDPSLQQAIAQDHNVMTHSQTNNIQPIIDTSDVYNTSPVKGTQIVRSDGRIVVIPPIERPTTRSRNKPREIPEVRQVSRPVKPLDNEHVSGNELDSSNDEHTEEDESEDDPNKLWCICNQPHNNRFMICCDTCEEWYHGKCVNVTKAMGQMMEQEGREWICLYCKDPLLKRPSAAARRIRKASRTSTDSGGSQRKLSTTSLSETTPTTPPTTMTPACIVCSKPSRNSSIYCSDSCILKHAQGVEKVVVFDRKTGKILSGNNAPSAANLEKWLQEHPSYEVVRSTSKPSAVKKMAQSKLQLVKNTSNDGISLAIHRKGVNIGVLQHSPKSQPSDNHKVRNQKKITGLKIISKQVALNKPKQTKLIQPVPIIKTPTLTSTPIKPKTTQPAKVPTTPTIPKEKPVPQKTPKSRQAEVTNVGVTVQQPKQENIRDNVRKTLMEQLVNRIKMVDDLKLTDSQVTNISSEIESQLYKCFGDTGQKYRNKYRSLIFNIKDVKNQTLWRRICEKSINPYQLVRLSPDDLASQELALWREREAKHQLDMIKKSELELLNCNRQYVFKTHKGEQVFEDDRPTDQTVTEVITGLGADSTSLDKEEIKADSTKDKEKKILKHNKKDRKSSKEKSDSKEKRKDHRSSSRDRDRDRRKRSRSREHGSRHSEKIRSRSRDRDKDRHRRSSHKSSRHKKEVHSSTEKLDKKSKEILEQLVDKQIVPPLEDRLWKHVPQEDIVPTPNIESDSDHEPSSTVTIPTPPRTNDQDEVQSSQPSSDVTDKIDKRDLTRSLSTDSNELLSPKEENSSLSPPTSKTTSEHVWKGTINMVDVAQISITAHEVSGDCSALDDELPVSLDIVGRISPETVWDYIGKMRCSNSKIISLLRLNATNMEEKMPYIALYSYLSSRNRLGVVKSTNKAVKDFYILPLASQKPIPQALLPISGPGFEESRPPLLLGIIVRDKRKRPLLDSFTNIVSKRSKIDIPTPVVPPPAPATPPIPTVPPRSYTPPPNRDPRLKVAPMTVTAVPLPTPPPVSLPSPPLPPVDDMDEPYSPEDSDPDATTPPPPIGSIQHPKLTSNLPIVMTPPVKSSTFLDTPVNTQTFKPFVNKFDTIPGLEDAASLPASSLELQRKMAELDQRIAMQKAEIDNMSQDIASSASTDIGTSALANIALPSNLQQILDSIKTIGAVTNETIDIQTSKNPVPGSQSDLTIPLMLPKISSRPLTGVASQKLDGLSPTIPLNLPKIKSKHSATNSPQRVIENEKSNSVLSSLSEEDLIRKAAEMLGETESSTSKKLNSKEHVAPTYNPSFNPSLFNTPPPPIMLPPPPLSTQVVSTPPKRSKIDMNQPPIPGLEDEC